MKKRKTTKTGKCGYTLMLVSMALSALFLTAGKHEHKGREEMPLQAGKEAIEIGLGNLERREQPEDTRPDTGGGQKTAGIATTDGVIIYEHDLLYSMQSYYKDEEVPYVDEETFGLIWEAYKGMDYTVECKKGDPEVYEEYKQKFWQMLQNEIPFLNPKTGEETYLKDWRDPNGNRMMAYREKSKYLFFDVNGDGLPELCYDDSTLVYAYDAGIAVFAYDADTDQVTLWTWTKEIAGTRTGYNYDNTDSNDEIREFFRFDEDGDIEAEILLWKESAGMSRYNDINMVMLPYHADSEKRPEVTEKMKQQGIYEESSGQWLFRITDDQYEMLAEPLGDLIGLALHRQWESEYTYEGLFGEYMTE